MEKNAVLQVSNLHKSYGSHKIIDSLELRVEKGDVYGFLGPNGAGKTTTIRMLLGLVHYDAGQVILNGYDIKRDFKRAIERVGAVVETPRFYESYSGYQNLRMMASLYSKVSNKRIQEVLALVDMEEAAHDRVDTYSLGMKQRIGIAQALLNSPEFIILDEPTNGLDPQGMKDIRDMIIRLSKEQGITFFISSHLLHEIELMCNRVAIIKGGKKLVEGNVKELLSGEYETVEIHTKAKEKARDLLNSTPYVKESKVFEEGIRVEIEKDRSTELNMLLVTSSIPVRYIIPRGQSLENYYMELTREGGRDVV